MRLLDIDSLEFTEFRDRERPSYAIASHRWQEEEVTYQEVRGGYNKHKKGYKKVAAFARYLQESVRSVKWLWIDTCCINKDSTAELSEAINLMFDWYRNAEVCLAYLVDVNSAEVRTAFTKSEWFERGWTLQELLAPKTVVFLTESWQVIGNKGAFFHKYSGSLVGPGLENNVAARTGIMKEVLHDYDKSLSLAADTRLKWMEGRETSREEDMSYALYGIFNVALGANYGEGFKRARQNLLAAIYQQDDRGVQQATQFRRITDWLSPPDPWTNHETARQRHEDQTGSWLLQSEQYQKWKMGLVRNLWLYGKAGCGKTILCSTVIEDIRTQCDQGANTGYAVFYFSFSDNHKQWVWDFVLSLAVQLGWKEPGLSMLQQAYKRPNRSLPGLGDLENILLASVKSYDELFLIADALDECPEGGDIRQKVLEFLARLSQQAPNLQILATSREVADVRDLMEKLGAAPLSIAEHIVDADVRKYVAAQLLRDYRLSRLDPATKTRIEETISTKSNGM